MKHFKIWNILQKQKLDMVRNKMYTACTQLLNFTILRASLDLLYSDISKVSAAVPASFEFQSEKRAYALL